MRNSKIICLILMFVLTACFAGKKDKISIKSSTAILPIIKKAAEKFRKSETVVISIDGNGSENAIIALLNATCDIAASSYRISPQKIQEAAENGRNLKEVIIAYDIIIPVVNPVNTIDNFTKEQLKDIYSGKISSWKGLGWVDEKIAVISRDSFSGILAAWNEKIMKRQAITVAASVEDSNEGVINAVSDNPYAIGYIASAYLNNRLKPSMVENFVADVENARLGKYPLIRELFVYFDENNISEKAKKFALFLITAEGQDCVIKAGYIPLKM